MANEHQNIVIVGGSVAGQSLANALVPTIPDGYRILLVDSVDYAYWPIASLRAAVVPGWEKRVTAPLKTSTVFPADKPHQVVAPNKVVELRKSSVVVEKPFEGSTEIPFFKCILATGSLQPAPMRPAEGATEKETHDMLAKLQKEISQATKVVIVGGGTVGLEIAGEIRELWPKTEITIVHSLASVLNPSSNAVAETLASAQSYSAPYNVPKLSKVLEDELARLDIHVVLNDRVDIPTSPSSPGDWDGSFGLQPGLKQIKLGSGKTLEADFVFVSVGNKANSTLVDKADSGAVVQGMGKMIAVDEYLKVKSTNPDSMFKGDYYAIGDACSTPGWKTSQTAVMDAEFTAINILAEIKSTPLKPYKRSLLHFLVVPLGSRTGAGAATLPYLGTWMLPLFLIKFAKSARLFVEDGFYARFKGAEPIPKVPVPVQAA